MQAWTVALASTLLFASSAGAATEMATLAVPGMTCGACPITVHMALSRVPGVEKVRVEPADKEVIVRFNDQKTQVGALLRATRDAGYPAHVVTPSMHANGR
ncbi:mercury resistance system periplasmic binding protein MerP [Acidithiobacillus ferrianus]|uniref:Periplasmic mercury ion-binding protein n=2 Tax=Acidithiobacillus ferrianus TaxID=2678518 RepID=A0A845U5G0_9PROT|nr:mercury resistance system periplasmic binding protein MerP [Acidithiobacillus ferrianus]NDU42526.1 mercury resistance system periplasmic binding protein MerP [Acidithiobacillus ferrianus]